MVLDDPTRGVDVGARVEMHARGPTAGREGTAVLIGSTDLAELVELCDRVLVFQRGRRRGRADAVRPHRSSGS